MQKKAIQGFVKVEENGLYKWEPASFTELDVKEKISTYKVHTLLLTNGHVVRFHTLTKEHEKQLKDFINGLRTSKKNDQNP